ncbi:MAG TPA: hypothetical protein VN175_07860 [Rhizomicrobium sp.]|nr:hypothetical protein [Rhizomicrobium sp.]
MNRAIAIGSALVLGTAAWAVWHFLLAPSSFDSSAVFEAGNGHAYQFIAAPNIGWNQARAGATKLSWRGHAGYLATIKSATEYQLVLDRLFSKTYPDVTYLGGRQTAPGEWRWVTGPDGLADGGKGKLFWRGDETGTMPPGGYANWMATAFQHGGKWDVGKVCCVSLFSYGIPQFSTSLGTGDADEHIAGYLVEFDD